MRKFTSYWSGIIAGFLLISILSGAGYGIYNKRATVLKIVKHCKNIIFQKYRAKNVPTNNIKSQKKITGSITIHVNPSAELKKISRLLYGSNLSPQMESEPDIIKFIQNTGISCFRFPGGGSPGYHWKSGKSDFSDRYTDTPLSDIDYAIEFSRRSNAETITQVNLESGTPKEAAEWVEYMNKKAGFRVNYWELGNEVFGDWDKAYMSADKYAKTIKEYATAMKKIDPDIKIGMNWKPAEDGFMFNSEMLKKAGDQVDFISFHWYPNHINASHRYKGRIHPTTQEILANPLQIPIIVTNMKKMAPNAEVTFLEWDCGWDAPNSDFPPYSQGILQWSLANALFHADALGQMALSGVTVSTQYLLQDINFGLIRGWDKEAGWGGQRWDGETIRPKAFAIELFAKHFGDILIDAKVENSPSYYKEADWWPDSYTGEVPYISCYASKFSNKNRLALVIINKHSDTDYRINIKTELLGLNPAAKLYLLNGSHILAENDGNPGMIGIKEYDVNNISNDFWYTAPAHSVSVFEIDHDKTK